MGCLSVTPRVVVLALAALLAVRARAADVAMDAMRDELTRTMRKLRLESMDAPYFVSFRMDERTALTASAELGALTSVQPDRSRRLTVELRVGDHDLDNSNYLSAGRWGGRSGVVEVGSGPLDDDYQQIRRQLWFMADGQYKRALEDLSAKRAALRARTRRDELPDFTRERPLQVSEARARPCAPRPEIEGLVKELSAMFLRAPELHRSSVSLECQDVLVRYVNSEGTSFTRAEPRVKLELSASTLAPSALPIVDSVELFARSVGELPPRKALVERTRLFIAHVLAVRTAPAIERYNGPVLFEGPAAAEVFAQLFAPGLLADRRPVADDPSYETGIDRLITQMGGASFADKIGGRVLPTFMSVTNQPLQEQLQASPLLGSYRVDDDGVAARETKLVDHGTLKTLLATRNPVREVRASTGSRRGPGAVPANLLVSSDRALDPAKLRRELLRRAKARGLEFAIVVRRVGVGRASPLVRMAARAGASAEDGFAPAMAEVVRVFPDGREQLLQGAEIGDLAPAAFKDIVAVGKAPHVHSAEFLGGIGALLSGNFGQAGGMPVVTCAVPSLLFEDVTLVGTRGPFPDKPVTPSPLARQ